MGVDFVRFEVFTAVTMKNSVFWDIETQFVLHRRQRFPYRAKQVKALYDMRSARRCL
jgi:predicted TIM-barrel enzyme